MPSSEIRATDLSTDNLLRERVRDAIRLGTLPSRAPDHLFGGLATGALCAVCGAPTTSGEVELELEFLQSETTRTTFRVHPRCFSIFNLELARLKAKPCGGSA
jgi:hypothetical protein